MAVLGFFRKPGWRGIWLGLACAAAAWWLTRTPLLAGLEDWMLDACFSWRSSRPTRARVVLVGIDEDSLRELNKPLAYLSPELAEVVTYAHGRGAAAIGLDVLLPEGSARMAPVSNLGGEGNAWKLGQAVFRAGNVVLPVWALPEETLVPLKPWRLKADLAPDPEHRDLGFVNLTEDPDQFVRRQRLAAAPDEGPPLPHFALALYARAQGQSFSWDEGRGELRVGDEVIPLDRNGELRINFTGPPGAFQPVPFRDVLAAARGQQRALPDMKDAVVLIGFTTRAQQDFHPTPYANHYAHYVAREAPGLMAGTEIHAHILATLRDRAYITTPWFLAPPPLLVIFGVLLGRAFARLNLEWGLLLTVAHHFAWKGVALAAFSTFHWRVEVVAMLLLGVMTYSATFVWRWRVLRRMFGVVKSRDIALALDADPSRLDPGGELREVTVLFADVRNFSDFSREHTPHQVVALLNAYFGAVVPVIEGEGGTLNTYMGDGVMVLFNAPTTCRDHALRAVRTARSMVEVVHKLRARWAELDNPGMRIGVGVHTGSVVVGAIGSPQRLDYTAIGDAVNAAARLESANKEQKTEILISAATYAALPAEERSRLGCEEDARLVELKGVGPMKAHAVRVAENPAG
jgi:adenylate cyclase